MSKPYIGLETAKKSGIFEDVSDKCQEIRIFSNPWNPSAKNSAIELKFCDNDFQFREYTNLKKRFRNHNECPQVRLSKEGNAAGNTFSEGEFVLDGSENRGPGRVDNIAVAYITLIAENELKEGVF